MKPIPFQAHLIALLMLAAAAAPLAAGSGEKSPACPADQKVRWQGYPEALAQAQKEGKPIVVVFSKDFCRQCELLRDKGFNQPDNACYVNHHLAAALVNGDREPDLLKHYDVAAAPTVWFLTPSGDKIDFFAGYVPSERLALILHYIGDREYEKISFDDYLKEQEPK